MKLKDEDRETLRYIRRNLEEACIALDYVDYQSTHIDDSRDYCEAARDAVDKIIVENVRSVQ